MGKKSFEVAGTTYDDNDNKDTGYKRDGEKETPTTSVLLLSGVLLFCTLLSMLIYILCVTDVIDVDTKEEEGPISIKRAIVATLDGQDIHSYTLKNQNDTEVQVMTLGVTINSIRHNGTDVIVGFDKAEDYGGDKNSEMGGIMGRVAGPISGNMFELNGETHDVDYNNGSWNQAIWEADVMADHVVFTYTSGDLAQGFPGKVKVTVSVQLTTDDEIMITIGATTVDNKPTPINPMARLWFNLAGQGGGDISDHTVSIFANQHLAMKAGIPTGGHDNVNGTVYDMRDGTLLGDIFGDDEDVVKGVGDYFILHGASGKRHAARVEAGNQRLDVYTDQPGVHFSTGDDLDVEGGKGGKHYGPHSAFSLDSLNYPDAINQASFPDSVLWPRSMYLQHVWYKFTLIKS